MFEKLVIYIIPRETVPKSQEGKNDDMITIVPNDYSVKKGKIHIQNVKLTYRVKSCPRQRPSYLILDMYQLQNYINDLFIGTNLDSEAYDGINILFPGFPNWMYGVYDEKQKFQKQIDDILLKYQDVETISVSISKHMNMFQERLETYIQFVNSRIEAMMSSGLWPIIERHNKPYYENTSNDTSESESDSEASTVSYSVESS